MRRWFRQDTKKSKDNLSSLKDMLDLYNEIHSAKRDWDNAIRHFEYSIGKDQIDYAIFAIEAAEKRYEMLLRKAKILSGDSANWSKVIHNGLRGEAI